MRTTQEKEFALGIYGDGQLARLLALSAQSKNIQTLIFTLNEKDSPCRGIAQLAQGADWSDKVSFEAFCERCEWIVLENEFVPAELLLEAQKKGIKVLPDANSYSQVSDKLKQVELARSLSITIPNHQVILSESDLDHLQLPCMLKSIQGGYDGYGNFIFKESSQREAAGLFIRQRGPALAQEFLNFDCEVAVVVANDGKIAFTFPVVETIQEKSICNYVLIPPRFSAKLQQAVQKAALDLIRAISGKGIFGVEFFIIGDKFIFNEIAPRPHNSCHFSIEACSYSQFDAIIKLIQGEPMTPPEMLTPAAGMLNLLGTQNGKARFEGDAKFHRHPKGFLHLYGKEDSRIGRKMGHFTLLGNDQNELLRELAILKGRYSL